MGIPRTCFVLIAIHLISVIKAQEMEKRVVPQGFIGMRGKKYLEDDSEMYKRRPQYAFIGVKGKKSFYDFSEYPDTYIKRGQLGFLGVRGKKESMFPENDIYPVSHEFVPKRDGSLIGQIDYTSNEVQNLPEYPLLNELLYDYIQKMDHPTTVEPELKESESKETTEENERITNEVEKRASKIHQFFGVRGKKAVQNKRPYDLSFRGKFIGVRGKKDLRYSSPQEIKFLMSGPFPKRKGQMGFFGMRGKKWTDESSPEFETLY